MATKELSAYDGRTAPRGSGGIVPWLVFLSCLPFTYFTVSLPLQYYLAAPEFPHRSDYSIGWFWMTAYGFGPALILALLTFVQRARTKKILLVLWCSAAAPVILSAGLMLSWAVR